MASKNTIIIYHADCPDGFGGAFAAWKKFGNKAEYIPLGYGDSLSPGLKNKEIYIVDFSLQKKELLKLIKNNKRVTGIDHHASSEKETKLTYKYSYSNKNSGAVLAWKYFHPKKEIPKMFKFIERIDLGIYSDEIAKTAGVLIESYSFDFKEWNILLNDFNNPKKLKALLGKGKAILAYENVLIKDIVQSAKLVKIAGHKAYAIGLPKLPINFKSKIALSLMEKGVPLAILWRTHGKTISVSLRSGNAVNAFKIAQKYGGGGHKQSAGFSIPSDKPLPWRNVDSIPKKR